MTPPTDPTHAAGSQIGDYKILGALGEGGAGHVLRVEHQLTHRIEAMKFVAARHGATDEEANRLLGEVRMQASLDHPNIARVFNAMWHGDDLVVAMELVEGDSLDRVLSRSRLPLSTAVRYALDTLSALAYAHSRGVIHRDISPRNLMIDRDGRIKVTDFGLAQRPGEVPGGGPSGTLFYAAPEQIRARDQADPRADLYSLGAVLYEMVTGRRPFDGESPFAIMRGHIESTPVPPRSFNPETPEALEQVILRALEKDPAARFPSAAAFRDALKAVKLGEAMLRQRLWLGLAAGFFTAIAFVGAWYAHSIINRPPEHLVVTAPKAEAVTPSPEPPTPPVVEPPKPDPKAAKKQAKKTEAAPGAPLPSAADVAVVNPALAPVVPAQPVAAPQVTPPPKPVEIPAGAFRLVRTISIAPSAVVPAFAPDGTYLAAANGASIDLINSSTGERIPLGGHTAMVTSFAFSRDGARLVSGSRDGTVKVWDVASRSEVRSIAASASVSAVAFSRDQQWVAAATADRKLKAWSLVLPKEIRELKDIKAILAAVAFTPDGRGIAGASPDRPIPVWTLDKARPRVRLDGWDEGSTTVAMSPGGERFAAASGDKVKQFDLRSGDELKHVQIVGRAQSLVYTPDGRCLAVSSSGNSARLWDIDTAEQIRALPLPGPAGAVCLAPSGRRIAAVSGATSLTIWDGKP